VNSWKSRVSGKSTLQNASLECKHPKIRNVDFFLGAPSHSVTRMSYLYVYMSYDIKCHIMTNGAYDIEICDKERFTLYKFWKSFVFLAELKVHFYLSKWLWIKKVILQNVFKLNFTSIHSISPCPALDLW
jgi:hypothetical protein